LGATVEDLFAPHPTQVLPALGGQLREGALLRVGRVDTRLVAAELPDHGAVGAVWASPDGIVEQGQVRLLGGGSPAGFVVAGCDPALGVAEGMLAGLGPMSLLAISAPTGRALHAMQAGLVHAAVVHGRPKRLPKPPLKVARWHLARWQVGLAAPRRRKALSLEAVLQGNGPIIQRDPDAACQQAFERASRSAGFDVLPPGPRASSHLDAARTALFKGATAITIEAGARAFGLDFLPLEEHTVELWVDDRWRSHPGLEALGQILATPAFIDRVSVFGGYDLTHCGERVEAA